MQFLKNFTSHVKQLWEEKPLPLIMFLACAIRLLSVLFAKGWGMLDDHFLVIEVAQSWADGFDVNSWLPWTPGNKGPEGHSFLYVGLHYILFVFLKGIGLHDPQNKMYVVRFLHAMWSLLVVFYGYKLALRFSNQKTAKQAGLLLALYWFMPWASVRNLVEIVAIPLLMVGTWMLATAAEKKTPTLQYLLAGFVVGFAFSVRYQTGVFIAGMGLAILLQKELKALIWFSTGVLLSILAIQGGIDMFIWGRPFAEMGEYIQYNMDNKYSYFIGEWYNYLLLLGGIMIPPISLFLLFGMFYGAKKRWLLFLPMFFFLVFHSWYPNKQERFILTIVPFIVIAGLIGWNAFREKSAFWARNFHLNSGIWKTFWVLNIILLLPLSTTYSKKSRVEAMRYLYKYPNITEIMVENTNSHKVDILPQFYAGQKITSVEITRDHPLRDAKNKDSIVEENSRFVLFVSDENLKERLKEISRFYPNLEYETTVTPGLIDNVLYTLNPSHNTNQTIYIYRNKKFYPKSLH